MPIFCFWQSDMDIQALCTKTLTGLGYELIAVEHFAGRGIRVTAERRPQGITVEDCAAISQHLTCVFAAENIDYTRLEVSSPGLDRALEEKADFVRAIGKLVRIKAELPQEKSVRKIIGRLVSIEGNELVIETQNQKMILALSNIRQANLEPEL